MSRRASRPAETPGIFVFGGYRNRNPLAYAPIRRELGDRIALPDSPAEAQILLVSHYRDFELFGAAIAAMLRQSPRLRLVLLSEEPYWDSCWMPDPFARRQQVATPFGTLDCTVLNHATSRIYRPARIPYFLLTDPRYIARYRPRFDRNAGWGAQDWQHHFARAPADAVFLAARRSARSLAPEFGGDTLRGLSVWRSRMAAACTGDRVIREGTGWSAGPPRHALADWHADKLDRFDLRARYMGAFENTHHDDYVSEKIWDAFAAGAVPLYLAGPGHALHRLAGPDGWLNFHAHLPQVPVFDAARPVDAALAAAYAAQQERLARLFHDRDVIAAEYDRFCTALLAEFAAVLRS